MTNKKTMEESEKIQRARAKLRRKLAAIDAQVNPQALERKSKEIHRWISRHTRIPLKNKTIALFDENQNSAHISKKTANLALRIGEDLGKPLEMLLDQANADLTSKN